MLALGGLVVAALFAALLVPFFVDWSSFRVAFEDQASRLLGKKVAVHGSVDARILPFPSVTLHDVRVGQDVDGQPLVQVARDLAPDRFADVLVDVTEAVLVQSPVVHAGGQRSRSPRT